MKQPFRDLSHLRAGLSSSSQPANHVILEHFQHLEPEGPSPRAGVSMHLNQPSSAFLCGL